MDCEAIPVHSRIQARIGASFPGDDAQNPTLQSYI